MIWRVIVRSHEVSNPWNWEIALSCRFAIWYVSRLHCCRDACQITKRHYSSKIISCDLECSWDLSIRCSLTQWMGALATLLTTTTKHETRSKTKSSYWPSGRWRRMVNFEGQVIFYYHMAQYITRTVLSWFEYFVLKHSVSRLKMKLCKLPPAQLCQIDQILSLGKHPICYTHALLRGCITSILETNDLL